MKVNYERRLERGENGEAKVVSVNGILRYMMSDGSIDHLSGVELRAPHIEVQIEKSEVEGDQVTELKARSADMPPENIGALASAAEVSVKAA